MVELEPNSPAEARGGPNYGHLSEMDPAFAKLRAETDKAFAALWALPLEEFKSAWLTAPVALPADVPQPGKDYEVADTEMTLAEGARIGLRVYKPSNPPANAVLVLKTHGGGKSQSMRTFWAPSKHRHRRLGRW
jgi:hypothetical protein